MLRASCCSDCRRGFDRHPISGNVSVSVGTRVTLDRGVERLWRAGQDADGSVGNRGRLPGARDEQRRVDPFAGDAGELIVDVFLEFLRRCRDDEPGGIVGVVRARRRDHRN